MIVALEPWHLVSLSMRLRESDLLELAAFGIATDAIGRQRWACASALECAAGITAADAEGRPIACFGVREGRNPRVGSVFLVATDGWEAYLRDGIRAWRKFKDIVPWNRLEALVRSEAPANARFAVHMGFRLDCRLPGVREDGGDLLQFSLTKKE